MTFFTKIKPIFQPAPFAHLIAASFFCVVLALSGRYVEALGCALFVDLLIVTYLVKSDDTAHFCFITAAIAVLCIMCFYKNFQEFSIFVVLAGFLMAMYLGKGLSLVFNKS